MRAAAPLPSKSDLRARFRAARKTLSEGAYAERSAAIVTRLAALPEVAAAQTVHVYWPLAQRREVDTRPLIDRLAARGVRVVLPVVLQESNTPRLRHALYEGREALHEGAWGIPEPAGTATVEPEELDVIVVPAFGAGRNGHRIGHGAGYYDAFLRGLSAFTVCPVYDACLVRAVPAEAHDVPVAAVVTETQILRPGKA